MSKYKYTVRIIYEGDGVKISGTQIIMQVFLSKIKLI